MTYVDTQEIQFDPATVYERPFDVVRDMTLTVSEKIEILQQWLDDASRAEVGDSHGDRSACAVTKALQFFGAAV